MAKGYWVTTYRSVSNPEALAKYAGPAAEIIQSHGGRILARGMTVRIYEGEGSHRCVVVEFDSVEKAIAAYESDAYREVRSILKGAVEREVRIVEGV